MATIETLWPSVTSSAGFVATPQEFVLTSGVFEYSLNGAYSSNDIIDFSFLSFARNITFQFDYVPIVPIEEVGDPATANLIGTIYIDGTQNGVELSEPIAVNQSFVAGTLTLLTSPSANIYSTINRIRFVASDGNTFTSGIAAIGLGYKGYVSPVLFDARDSVTADYALSFDQIGAANYQYQVYQSMIPPKNLLFADLVEDQFLLDIPGFTGENQGTKIVQLSNVCYALVVKIDNTVDSDAMRASSLLMQLMVL